MSLALTQPAAIRDAVGVAERLRRDLTERICHEAMGTSHPFADVYVGWVAALEAATCPARYRASGADGWGFPGWSPVLAGAAVGRAALARQLQLSGPDSPLYPLEAVRGWVREMARSPIGPVGEWVGDLARDEDRAALAAVAANATRWVAGFVRVLGWPLPDHLGLVDDGDGPYSRRWPKRWRPRLAPVARVATGTERGRTPAVTVASSPDAVIGRVAPSGRFVLLVHRPVGPGDGAASDRAAFEAAAGAMSCGIVAAEVVVATADSGERLRFPVDDRLLARGAGLIVEVVRQRALAQDEWDFADATPSAACRHCPATDSCPAGQTWLAGPGRWQGGLPTL